MGSRAEYRNDLDPASASPVQILVVEDAVTAREMLSRYLVSRGYRVQVVPRDEAVRRLRIDRPQAVIVNLAGNDGLDLMSTCRSLALGMPMLVVCDPESLSGHHALETGTRLISRPFAERELDAALAGAMGRRPDLPLPPARRLGTSAGPALLGQSPRIVEVRELIERAADTDVTVLVLGESGTGKEITARSLRQASLRRDKPFVKVNCAALPTDLLESELFGHEKGAFTGAMQARPGKFELADHGTIFLDEIGEMTPILQAKLLQVLQDGEFSRLGSASDVRVDVRIIAATNRDLKRAVADGQFREDLYFRLNVVAIALPPLREHKEDIPLLAEHFLRQESDRLPHRASVRLSPETKRLFLEYDWPGNVRELENLIKRLLVLGSDVPIRQELRDACEAAALAPARSAGVTESADGGAASAPSSAPVDTGSGASTSLKEIGRAAARVAERVAILDMLERTRWNRKEAAEILGISYKALLYKIKDNGLDDRH